MYSFPNFKPVCSMSGFNCCFLFPQFVVIHIVRGFSIVNQAEVDVFLKFPSFVYDPMDSGNLISGYSAFAKSSLNIWKFMVHILLKPGLENFERYFASMWDECNCEIVWAFFGIAFLWDWNENSPVATVEFSKFAGSTFLTSSFRIWNSSTVIPSLLLAWFIVDAF